MRRHRLTWQQRGGADRRASAHPAYPDEGPASPAYKPDPEADAYENGDTSSWAEDPHPGPYPNSAHPAYPDEGPASPAYKAASLERALEKKAARCLRLASAIMGPGAHQAAIEDQALSFMDLSDRAINASLARLAGDEAPAKEEAEEAPAKEEAKSKKARTVQALLRLIADEGEDEATEEIEEVEEDDEEAEDAPEAKKKASPLAAEVANLRRQVASLRARLAAEDKAEAEDAPEAEDKAEAKKKASSRRRAYGWAMTPHTSDDAALEAMLEQEGMTPHTSDDAALEAMLEQEGMTPHMADDTDTDPEIEAMLAQMMAEDGHESKAEAMLPGVMADAGAPAEAMYEEDPMDPLGVLSDLDAGDGLTDDDYMLASLFGMKSAGEDKKEEAEDKAEAEDKKEEAAKKEARLRPQPKTASTGATRLGGGVIGKAAASEVSDLSALWESAPDVSKFF